MSTRKAQLAVMTVAACLGLAACQATGEAPSGLGASQEPDSAEVFIAMIGAERWRVLIDRAQEGVTHTSSGLDGLLDNEMLRADHALKSGAAELLVLRNAICARGLMSGGDCDVGAWPAWTLEPPSALTPLAVIEERSQWLGAAIQSYVAVGCDAGRTQTGDDMFCSVE